MIKSLPRRAICACLVVMGLSASALAAQPSSTGLGQAWPNAQDVSASTHWHVYVFASNGIRYVQVNDLNGRVRAAFATANGQYLVLPMGRDAGRVSTPQHAYQAARGVVPLTAYGETVYRDRNLQLRAVPLSDGTTMFTATSTDVAATVTTPCDDPAVCNTHLN